MTVKRTGNYGRVWFNGAPADGPNPEIGFVFQKTNLMPWRTVVENVLLPLEIRDGRPDEAARHHALDLLDLVGLTGFADAYPRQLSGGMSQRVILARTLIQRPRLLLMDEPVPRDVRTRERLNLELQRIVGLQEQTVLMVTHSIQEAVFLSDRVLVLKRAAWPHQSPTLHRSAPPPPPGHAGRCRLRPSHHVGAPGDRGTLRGEASAG